MYCKVVSVLSSTMRMSTIRNRALFIGSGLWEAILRPCTTMVPVPVLRNRSSAPATEATSFPSLIVSALCGFV